MAAISSTHVKPSLLKKATRRKLCVAVLLLLLELIISVCQLVLGIWVHISVENVEAGAFWAPVLLLVGTLVSLEGMLFHYGRQKTLAMGVMLQVIGIFMALMGAVLDTVMASLIYNVDFGRCSYSAVGMANCTSEHSCDVVQLSFPKSCYCCYLTKQRLSPCYFRAVSMFEAPSLYGGVNSCGDVTGQYLNLLWTSAILCVLCCFAGIMAAIWTYSYRKKVKPQPLGMAVTTTITTPMLPERNQQEVTANWSSGTSSRSPSLDVPIPAPRNSLGRSSSSNTVGTLPLQLGTNEKSSTVPQRKKRRAPDIPHSQPSSSVESSPSRSAEVVVRPKRNSANLAVQLSLGAKHSLSGEAMLTSAERQQNSMERRRMLSASPSRIRGSKSPSREARSISPCKCPQPVENLPGPSDQQDAIDHKESLAGQGSFPARACQNSFMGSQENLQLSSEVSSPAETPSTSRELPSYSPSSSTSPYTPHCGALAKSSSVCGASAMSSRRETLKGVVKKRKSHKGPAPQPPIQQVPMQTRSLSPIPQSPPPPFVPSSPPSPPSSPPPFTSSPHMQYQHPLPNQPVTNIHVTFTAPPMGSGMQMPLTQPQGYTFHSHPSAPFL